MGTQNSKDAMSDREVTTTAMDIVREIRQSALKNVQSAVFRKAGMPSMGTLDLRSIDLQWENKEWIEVKGFEKVVKDG